MKHLKIFEDFNGKIFFTKYIPVKGDIKEGDKFLSKNKVYTFTGFDGAHSSVNTLESGWIYHSAHNTAQEWLSNQKKVNLFICTKDIKVGDMVSSVLSDCTYFCKATKEHLESNKRLDNNNEYFKIISEISPDADVKEGDTFTESELPSILKK